MSRVICTQYIDGVQLDEPRTVAPPVEGDTPLTVLARKAAGARTKGWGVVWRPDGKGFTAIKRYDAEAYREKLRIFELVEG